MGKHVLISRFQFNNLIQAFLVVIKLVPSVPALPNVCSKGRDPIVKGPVIDPDYLGCLVQQGANAYKSC